MKNMNIKPSRILISNQGEEIPVWDGVIEVKNKKACFDLICRAVEECFRKSGKTEIVKMQRRNFANTKVVASFCDCSDNFEYEKLRKLIIATNE